MMKFAKKKLALIVQAQKNLKDVAQSLQGTTDLQSYPKICNSTKADEKMIKIDFKTSTRM